MRQREGQGSGRFECYWLNTSFAKSKTVFPSVAYSCLDCIPEPDTWARAQASQRSLVRDRVARPHNVLALSCGPDGLERTLMGGTTAALAKPKAAFIT